MLTSNSATTAHRWERATVIRSSGATGRARLLRGAYHAFWPGRTARDQFDNFLGAYAPQPGDLALGNPAPIDDYPLWIAYYNPDPRPVLPHGWPSYQIWQYTDKGRVSGITENTCDMDRFAGTMG
jgi:GH25 family lysozyme M1 (1,4-beta-N-acetylmuramidase)